LGNINKGIAIFLCSTLKGGIIMSGKWLLTLLGSLLAAMIVTGCADDQDPAPPTITNQEDPTENNGSQEIDEHSDENMDNGTESEELLEEEGVNRPDDKE
jgi:hypothetical protein